MDNVCFDSALKSLSKTQHRRRLIQILTAIREGVTSADRVKRIHSSGSLKYIVSCLEQDNRGVVDLALSILGNCSCLDQNCAKSLVQHHRIIPALCAVFDKYDEDSIKGRIFRIIGNLNDVVISSHIVDKEPEIITKTVQFLNDVGKSKEVTRDTPGPASSCPGKRPSEPTIVMAVRIFRKLLMKNTLNPLLINHEVLKAIGMNLIKYTELWVSNRKHENILNEIIKVLVVFSNYKHVACVTQLKNTPLGDSLKCFKDLILQFSERIIKIITNFYKTCSLKSDIPIIDISKVLMDGISNSKNNKDGTVNRDYLRALCKICDESGSREQIKEANVIPFLVNILKDIKPESQESYEHFQYVLSSIITCKYDYVLVNAQINSGIINIFTAILELMYGKSNNFKNKHNCKRRQPTWKSRTVQKKFKKHLSDMLEQDMSVDWTPVYNNKELRSERSASPSSSSDDMSSAPNSPHYPIFADVDDLSDSDNYSPICSDNDEAEHNDNIATENEKTPSESDNNEQLKVLELARNKSSVHFMVRQQIHTLLKWYTTVKPTVLELTDPSLIMALTKAATDLNDPLNSSFDLLLTILNIQECLVPLMYANYIPAVYSLTIYDHTSECSECVQLHNRGKLILEKLRKLAESGGGRGEIAHILLRSANEEHKEKLALSIPYIVGNKSILRNLLVNCDGIEVFMDILKNKETLQELCVRGICELAATQLKIKSPIEENKKPVKKYDEKDYIISDLCESIVTFKLDDGATIKADRNFLSDNCEYFNRLLSGNFRESHEAVINLMDVNTKAFNIVLVFMQEGFCNKQIIKFADLTTALEAIALSDRYILTDLSAYLAECVGQTHLSVNTVPEIYQWSIESGTSILRIEAVAFALVGEVTSSERFSMFQRLFKIGYLDNLVSDIKTLLVQFLGQCS